MFHALYLTALALMACITLWALDRAHTAETELAACPRPPRPAVRPQRQAPAPLPTPEPPSWAWRTDPSGEYEQVFGAGRDSAEPIGCDLPQERRRRPAQRLRAPLSSSWAVRMPEVGVPVPAGRNDGSVVHTTAVAESLDTWDRQHRPTTEIPAVPV
jgi:hypothetical protein